MKSPSAIFMMLALWMDVTVLRPLSDAYLNANSATRVLALRVITCGAAPRVGRSAAAQRARRPPGEKPWARSCHFPS